MQPQELFAMVFILGLLSGVFIIFMGLRQRSQQLEMRHRERMAMIERGQIPLEREAPLPQGRHMMARSNGASSRSLSFGIVIVGMGLALMTIISIAGDSPEVGVGIGGAVAILGGAFIVRSLVVRSETSAAAPRRDAIAAPDDDAS